MMILTKSLLALTLALSSYAGAQVTLTNPSFEGDPAISKVPTGWFDCSYESSSAPDTQPGICKVSQPAMEGATYLGMATKADGSYHSVGQKLSSPLLSGHYYTFSIYARRDPQYESALRTTIKKTPFQTPCLIRLFGSSGTTSTEVLLSQTAAIESYEWTRYDFTFSTPWYNLTQIRLEAFFTGDQNYNGNVMIDNCSAFTMVSQ